MFKHSILLRYTLIGWFAITSTVACSFDLKAKYSEVNFGIVATPSCGVEEEHIPALPKDPNAILYYQVARKILGQNDTDHFKQMYILADQSAKMGYWKAKLLMADLYLKKSNSYYSEYDPKKAKAYIDELVEQDVPVAFYAMAQYKLNGMPEFTSEPIPASVFLFEAAKLNNPRALSDMYDIFAGLGRLDDAKKLLECGVKQKENTAQAMFKLSNVLEEKASTEEDWIESFKYLYLAAKEGSYDAIVSFPNKERYYKQLFGEDFFGKDFLTRMKLFQNAMNSLYSHVDPYRKSLGKPDKVVGNIYLSFPNLARVIPFPPAILPQWSGDVGIALSPEALKIYQTDFDYDVLAKEAQANSVPEVPATTNPVS